MLSLRIGIVGDCGVGKSALSMKICSLGSMSEIDASLLRGSCNYNPTIGCDIHIIECYYAPKNTTFTVEIFDMGGNPRFEKRRNVYIDGCHGFIFVWDCSLEVTYHSLQKWLHEISAAIDRATVVNEDTKKSVVDEDIENLLSSGQGSTDSDNKPSIPILIVGNKIDSVSVSMQQELRQACPQQLFMTCISADWDFQPLLEFFCEVYTLHYGEIPGEEELEGEAGEEEELEGEDIGMESPNNVARQSASQAWSSPATPPFPSFVTGSRSTSQQPSDPSSPLFHMAAATPGRESSDDAIEWPATSSSSGAFTLLRHRVSKW